MQWLNETLVVFGAVLVGYALPRFAIRRFRLRQWSRRLAQNVALLPAILYYWAPKLLDRYGLAVSDWAEILAGLVPAVALLIASGSVLGRELPDDVSTLGLSDADN